jgi:hypothetical protein
MDWTAFIWLAATLIALLVIERWIHRHLQGVALLLTGDPEAAAVLYALPLLPGIVLHELSHAITAVLVGARVGRISLRPKRVKGRIQLGFVPVEETDVVRTSLIGLAPLLTGSGLILWIGYRVFGLGAAGVTLLSGDWVRLTAGLSQVSRTRDIWLWAYLIFSISSTMLPSQSDRQAWGPVILFLLLIGGGLWAVGLGPALIAHSYTTVAAALRWLATICALTIAVDIPFALFIGAAEKLLERIRGWRVEYQA